LFPIDKISITSDRLSATWLHRSLETRPGQRGERRILDHPHCIAWTRRRRDRNTQIERIGNVQLSN